MPKGGGFSGANRRGDGFQKYKQLQDRERSILQARYEALQQRLRRRGRAYDPSQPHEIVVLPSFSLDPAELKKITGVEYYEERMLFALGHLANPKNKVTFVSSVRVDPSIVTYYLSKLPDPMGARKRLRMEHLYDSAADVPVAELFHSLAQRLAKRPENQRRILSGVDRSIAHIYPFVVSEAEKELAVRFGIPVLGSDPRLQFFGEKDGGRQSARAARVALPPGTQRRVFRQNQLAHAVSNFVQRYPTAEALMIKLTQSFSGEGNAKLDLRGLSALGQSRRIREVKRRFSGMTFMAGKNATWAAFRAQLNQLGAVVELFMPGVIDSPSVQVYVGPDREVEILSTFTQKLLGQEYLGGDSPAAPAFLDPLHQGGLRLGRWLGNRGVMGRFAIDMVITDPVDASARGLPGPGSYYIETNLRLGGTTHSVNLLRLLMSSEWAHAGYHPPTGALVSARTGRSIYHSVTDNVDKEIGADALVGLDPKDVIALVKRSGLDWNRETETGILLHTLGSVTRYGKIGFTAAAESPAAAAVLYAKALQILKTEGARLRRNKASTAQGTM